MKKTTLSLLALLILTLTACESPVPQDSNAAKENEAFTSSLCGTYIGKNGSVLTLFEDGFGDYYYMQSGFMDRCSWSYENETLTVVYNGYDLIAPIAASSAFRYTLSAADEDSRWVREEFFKVSNEMPKRSVEDCRQLLRDTLKQSEMDNFDSSLNQQYTIGNNSTVEIPFYWNEDKSQNGRFVAEEYDSEICVALLQFFSSSADISNDDFNDIAADMWNDAFESNETPYVITAEPHKIYAGDYVGIQGTCKVSTEEFPLYVTVAIINLPHSKEIYTFNLITTENTIFKYDSDFNKILASIAPAADATTSPDNTVPVDEKSAPDGGSAETPSGITPELKEFLDSYEACVDRYIAFMEKYQNSGYSYSMMSDYLAILEEYNTFVEKADAYNESTMSREDLAYYVEVTSRISQKLIMAAYDR